MTNDAAAPQGSDRDDGGDAFVPSDAGARAFAVDPMRNVVLEASAGTGKTSVLVSRYLNLIRAGVAPSNILAITFTRKAAAEMRERIVRDLRKAAALSLVDAARWRDLRGRLGDIAISTIDAFCLSLVREFPLEADLDPGFEVADETEIPRLVEEALDRTLRICRGLATTDEHIALVFTRLGENRIRAALASLLDRRLVAAGALAQFLAAAPAALTVETATAQAADRLRRVLDRVPGGRDRLLADGPQGSARFALLVSGLRGLEEAPQPAVVRAVLNRLEQHVFTQTGTPRKQFGELYPKQEFPSEEARKRHLADIPAIAPGISDVLSAFDRDVNVLLARGIRRMFLVARREYSRALNARAVVDFAESLARALRLLGRMDEFAQSRYRLEARYHHVLVDELQDTSRAQWQLVARLVASWGEGAGLAHDAVIQPTVFVVGDRKQSIYAFRDAEVRVFRTARRHIEQLREDRDVRRALTHSFRSVAGLQVFANDLFTAVEKEPHRDDAFRYGVRDRFPVSADGGTIDTGAVSLVVGDGLRSVATAVAAEVERLLGGTVVRDRQSGLRRPAEPGDIAILFRARESHREFEQALAARRIPTYVYKGLGFFDADETKDLLALLRYLADPSSDLRAAAFLRSRFVRLSDGAVRLLSPNPAVALLGADPPAVAGGLDEEDRTVLLRARAGVAAWVDLVDRVPHAELLDRILAESAYAFETRGPRLRQARENLKKMRAIVRRIQNRGYATLGRIAEHLDRLSIGDESNAAIDALEAVNLMTVHAAKGLEFPIVFLVNIERGTGGRRDPVVVAFEGWHRRPVVSIDGMLDDADAAVRARDREETKRLLYVGITRARDRLYLAAALKDGRLQPGRGSLAELLPATFKETITRAGDCVAEGRVEWAAAADRRHILRVCGPLEALAGAAGACAEAGQSDLPDDFAVINDTTAVSRMSVTQMAAAGAGVGAWDAAGEPIGGVTDRAAALAGTLVHRLFQFESKAWGEPRTIEEVTDEARRLCRAEELAAVDRPGALLRHAAEAYLAIRQQPAVQLVLASGECLFEVPFSLALTDELAAEPTGILRGAIDCLVRRPDGRVLVVDFKTGAPRGEHHVQVGHYVRAAQLACGTTDVEGLLVYPTKG